MDKKNTSLGAVFAIAAALCLYLSYRYAPQQPITTAPQGAAAPYSPAAIPGIPTFVSESQSAAVAKQNAGATITTLGNRFINVRFTDLGGAIRDVEFLAHRRDGSLEYPELIDTPFEPYDFNRSLDYPLLPILSAFINGSGLDSTTRFELVKQTDSEVDYRAVVGGRLEVTRRYFIPPDSGTTTDPYQLRSETIFHNLGDAPYTPPAALEVVLGTAAPVNVGDQGSQLTTDYYRDGKYSSVVRSRLDPSNGWFGLGIAAHGPSADVVTPGPMQWSAVSNQFFTSIVTPDMPIANLMTRRVKVSGPPGADPAGWGITAHAQFILAPIPAHGSESFGAYLYLGPKEYNRLSNVDVFKVNQDRVMNFGMSVIGFFSALLLKLMDWTHAWVPNWGLTIIITTLLLKLCFIPLTLAQSRSAKRMQRLQPELKVIREKYKDNPQKQQTAQMELFKKHKVNPLGGCLPMLFTIPFFWGFFSLLRNDAELRFAHFLWAKDLTLPDTIGHVLGFPINVLPILLGGMMFLQTHFAPQPTVDNSQQKMMKYMPVMFTVLYYNWSCALALYSIINAGVSIAQQTVVNRMKEPELPPAPAPAGRSGKALKNITPGGKGR